MYLNMKTITIRDDVYKMLLSLKRESESFSDLFQRLSKRNLELLKELRGCAEFENKDKLIAEIRMKREERRY